MPARSAVRDALTRISAGIGGEAVAAASGTVLIADMVALKWYGFAGAEGPIAPRLATSTARSGWDALTTVRWLVVVTVGIAIAAYLIELARRMRSQHAVPYTGPLVLASGAVTSGALLYRVLISLPGHGTIADQKLGALIGLAAAVGVAWGGFESSRRMIAARRLPAAGQPS
jgi:hypothetical protein